MKATRVDNWPQVLARKVEEWRERPFAWGTADCCQFAAEVVAALTGTDHREVFPQYTSREDAEALLAEQGGMPGLVTSVLGDTKPAAWAHRGDLVLADFGEGPTVGVCLGIAICAPGPRGLVFRPREIAEAAWTV